MSNAHDKHGKYRGIIDEIREQQIKMKDMTWKQRFAYYWEYYKVHTIVTVIAIVAIVATAHSLATAKDYAFYGILLNANLLSSDAFGESFSEYTGIDTEEYECFIDADSTLSYTSSTEYDMATMQRIVAVVQTKELDAVVFDSQCFGQYAINEIFYDLREVLSPEQLEKYEPYFYYIDMDEVRAQEEADVMVDTDAIAERGALTTEEIAELAYAHKDPSSMGDPVPVGIFMEESPFATKSLAYDQLVPIFGISVTTQRTEMSTAFLDYLWDDTIAFDQMYREGYF